MVFNNGPWCLGYNIYGFHLLIFKLITGLLSVHNSAVIGGRLIPTKAGAALNRQKMEDESICEEGGWINIHYDFPFWFAIQPIIKN